MGWPEGENIIADNMGDGGAGEAEGATRGGGHATEKKMKHGAARKGDHGNEATTEVGMGVLLYVH